MAYKRSVPTLRMPLKEAEALTGVSRHTITNRLEAGWTRRQILGLDPAPGVEADLYWKEVMDACSRAERRARSEREALLDRARGGDEAAVVELREVYHLRRWMHAGRMVVA